MTELDAKLFRATPRRFDASTVVSVVVPCYDEAEVLPHLFQRLSRVADTWGTDYEVVLVDDGSSDSTWQTIADFHRRDPRWKGIRLARNFGHQTALRAGLQAASGDLIAVLDADLQDPPEVLSEFFAHWRQGCDVVYGVRRRRREIWWKRWSYHWFYRLLSLLSEVDVPIDAGDFCVMDRRILRLLQQMPERRPFIRGLRSWVGFNQLACPYDRAPRAAGKPKYGVARLVGLAIDGVLSSSIIPLRIATFLGAGASLLAFLGGVFVLLLKLGEPLLEPWGFRTVPGSASIILAVTFLGGIQLLCLGIFGEYLGRIYDNVKSRPPFTVSDMLGWPPSASAPTEREVR